MVNSISGNMWCPQRISPVAPYVFNLCEWFTQSNEKCIPDNFRQRQLFILHWQWYDRYDSHSNFAYTKPFSVHSWHLCLLMTNNIIQTTSNIKHQFLAKLSLSLAPLLIHITLIDQMHYSDIIMSVMASPITGVSIVCPTVGSGADQRKHQSSASLAFVQEEFTGDRWFPRTKG